MRMMKRHNSAFDVIHPLIWNLHTHSRPLPCILLLRVHPATGCSEYILLVFWLLSVDRPSSFMVKLKTSFELIWSLFDLCRRLSAKYDKYRAKDCTAHLFPILVQHSTTSAVLLTLKNRTASRELQASITWWLQIKKWATEVDFCPARDPQANGCSAHSNPNHVTNVGPSVSEMTTCRLAFADFGSVSSAAITNNDVSTLRMTWKPRRSAIQCHEFADQASFGAVFFSPAHTIALKLTVQHPEVILTAMQCKTKYILIECSWWSCVSLF
jgi:hypothetical protein